MVKLIHYVPLKNKVEVKEGLEKRNFSDSWTCGE